MHTAPTLGIVGSVGSGRTALAHIATTLPGVSLPSRVVRSMQRMARSSAHSLASRLIERLASDAARSSRPTASTAVTRLTSVAAWAAENRGATEAAAGRSMSVDGEATSPPNWWALYGSRAISPVVHAGGRPRSGPGCGVRSGPERTGDDELTRKGGIDGDENGHGAGPDPQLVGVPAHRHRVVSDRVDRPAVRHRVDRHGRVPARSPLPAGGTERDHGGDGTAKLAVGALPHGRVLPHRLALGVHPADRRVLGAG